MALTVPLTLSLRLSFNSGFVLDALPGWEEVMLLGKDEKRCVLADPAARRRLNELAQGDQDEATVGSGPTTFRSDLPAGASRLYAEATGIEHVVCNGAEIVSGGEFTGARPGTLLRSGTHTTGPSLI